MRDSLNGALKGTGVKVDYLAVNAFEPEVQEHPQPTVRKRHRPRLLIVLGLVLAIGIYWMGAVRLIPGQFGFVSMSVDDLCSTADTGAFGYEWSGTTVEGGAFQHGHSYWGTLTVTDARNEQGKAEATFRDRQGHSVALEGQPRSKPHWLIGCPIG